MALLLLASSSSSSVDYSSEEAAIQFLKEYDLESLRLANEATVAAWNYNTNITEHNAKISQEASHKVACTVSRCIVLLVLCVDDAEPPSVVHPVRVRLPEGGLPLRDPRLLH